jgi:hypothetical protein
MAARSAAEEGGRMLNLVIKGGRFEAARAAANRAIPLVFVREVATGFLTTTVGRTGEEQIEKVARWLAEVGVEACEAGSGFPAGTLLIYNHGAD